MCTLGSLLFCIILLYLAWQLLTEAIAALGQELDTYEEVTGDATGDATGDDIANRPTAAKNIPIDSFVKPVEHHSDQSPIQDGGIEVRRISVGSVPPDAQAPLESVNAEIANKKSVYTDDRIADIAERVEALISLDRGDDGSAAYSVTAEFLSRVSEVLARIAVTEGLMARGLIATEKRMKDERKELFDVVAEYLREKRAAIELDRAVASDPGSARNVLKKRFYADASIDGIVGITQKMVSFHRLSIDDGSDEYRAIADFLPRASDILRRIKVTDRLIARGAIVTKERMSLERDELCAVLKEYLAKQRIQNDGTELESRV